LATLTINCSKSAENVITGRELFKGAICCISSPEIVGRIASAN